MAYVHRQRDGRAPMEASGPIHQPASWQEEIEKKAWCVDV